MKKVSIIIPAYNVEKFIERCLDSIYECSVELDLFEVIVINDGSTDNTLNILEKYISKYPNLIVESQVNSGPSAARNHGIDISHGEYIWFVDSDDYICKNALTNLLMVLKDTEGLDALFFTLLLTDICGKESICYIQQVPKNVVITGKQALMKKYYPGSSCVALWRRSHINSIGLRFKQDIMYAEDTLFSFMAVSQANRLMFTDEVRYHYEKREGSSTTKKGTERIIKQKCSDIDIAIAIKEFSRTLLEKDVELSKLVYNWSQNVLFGVIYSLYTNKKEWRTLGINSAVLDKLKREGLYPLKGPFDNWKKTIMSKLLNIEILINK